MAKSMYYDNCEVVVAPREQGIEPTICIKEPNGKVTMVTVTPNHNFVVTDETGRWDIVDSEIKYVGK